MASLCYFSRVSVPASFPGAESPGTTVSLDAGAYSVSETGPAGYSASSSADSGTRGSFSHASHALIRAFQVS